MDNIPYGRQGVEGKYITRDTQCPHCHLIVERIEGEDGLEYCSDCGELLDDRGPLDYEPEIN